MSDNLHKKMTLFSMIVIFVSLVLYCGSDLSNEDQILKLYSDLSIEYSNENLRGIMKPISKDFTSDMYNMGNYEDFMLSNAALLRMNRNISVDIRNIEISLNDDKAEVIYSLHFISDQSEFLLKQKDFLKKSMSGWKIVSKEEID